MPAKCALTDNRPLSLNSQLSNMTDTVSPTALVAAQEAPPANQAQAPTGAGRFATAQPVLERLFELRPKLFGQHFLPLKLGIFQDLMAAHPQSFKRHELKLALGVHTRSTRYLQAVASGLPRHDLQGKPVEPVAPEHIFLSLVEVFKRRQARNQEDLLPKLQQQLGKAYDKSGLTRGDYLARVGTPEAAVAAVLDEAINQVDQQRARRAALLQAYQASGKTAEEFAAMVGRNVQEVRAALASLQ